MFRELSGLWSFVRIVVTSSFLLLWVCAQAQNANQAPGATPPVPAPVQSGPISEPAPAPPARAIQENPIGAVSTVKDNIVVVAGLLTPASASQLFGGWVAQHFLVVQVTIGNQSRNQQFILQDIFLDYSNWRLSGIYGEATRDISKTENHLRDYQSSARRGQISSIGALEMQDALKQNSVFSKRNFVVNGLVLIGSAAGGLAFLGPAGFTQGVTAYSSNFLPALDKFWPDRRIDQQSNLLKYGFQDKMVIAKEDPGKVYGFFPIERLLTKGLTRVYTEDPALFLNMAELYFEPGLRGRHHTELKKIVDQLVLADFPDTFACPSRKNAPPGQTYLEKCVNTPELRARVLEDLFSPCYHGRNDSNYPGEEISCALDASQLQDKTKPVSGSSRLQEIRAVKDLIAGLSLNTVKVVVSGIMTVNVEAIPGVLSKIQFDDPMPGSEQIWEDTSTKHTGVIYGKYLTGGKPVISGIMVPGDSKAAVDSYIVPGSLGVLPDKSTDSELHFELQFKQKIPSGTVLTFQVSKTSNSSVNDAGGANTQETTTSMALPYTVSYTPSASTPSTTDIDTPTIGNVAFNSPEDLLKPGQVSGYLLGANLDNAALSIKPIILVNGSTVDPKTYVSGGLPKRAPGSSSTRLNFTLTLEKGLPTSAKIVFEITRVSVGGSLETADSKPVSAPPS